MNILGACDVRQRHRLYHSALPRGTASPILAWQTCAMTLRFLQSPAESPSSRLFYGGKLKGRYAFPSLVRLDPLFPTLQYISPNFPLVVQRSSYFAPPPPQPSFWFFISLESLHSIAKPSSHIHHVFHKTRPCHPGMCCCGHCSTDPKP